MNRECRFFLEFHTLGLLLIRMPKFFLERKVKKTCLVFVDTIF